MNVELTVVVDNRGAAPLVAEHGFSLYIDTGEHTLLFDTGNKDALEQNMQQLKLSPAGISTLVLSHGHYDHTGGVAHLLRHNRRMEIYLHSGVFQPRYSLDGQEPAIVRMPLSAMEAISHHPDERVHWLTRPVQLTDQMGITGPIPRSNSREDTGGPFFLDPEGREPDTIKDDVAIWITTPGGLVVCLGCCHSGLINTLEAVTRLSGERRIAAIIGGLHLLHSSEERLAWTVAELGKYEIGRIIACHCSGEAAVDYLAAHLDVEVGWGEAGMVVQL